jgi:hypothetical protein
MLVSLTALSVLFQRTYIKANWYEYRPTSWVLDDLASRDEYTAFRAWTEIGRRRQIGKFSDDAECKLTDLALAAHARPYVSASSIDRKLRDYLNTRFQAGSLTPAQSDRLYTQTFVPSLHVRPRVVAGDDLPIWVEYAGFPSGFMRTKLDNRTITIGGQTFERHLLPDGPTPHHASKLTGVKVTKPGNYWITVEEDISANLHMTGPLSQGFAWTRHIVLQKKIEVLDKAPDDLITWIEQPNFETIRRAVSIGHVIPDQDGRFIVNINISNPRANLAFDVVARDQGKDYSLGQIAVEKNGYISQDLHSRDLAGRTLETLDLQFRSSEAAARNTTDLFEIWKGVFSLPTKPARR